MVEQQSGNNGFTWDYEKDCKPGRPENQPFVAVSIPPESEVVVESMVSVPLVPRRVGMKKIDPEGRVMRDPQNGFQG